MKKFTLHEIRKLYENGDLYPTNGANGFSGEGIVEIRWTSIGGKSEAVEIIEGCCINADQWLATKYRDDGWYPMCVCSNPAHWAVNCQVLSASNKQDAIKLCNEENAREQALYDCDW